jgi:hypothetical protein
VEQLNDKVKIALIAAAAVISCVAIYVYFSPYQSCAREIGEYACAKALGGKLH